jgi:hypothetical protein
MSNYISDKFNKSVYDKTGLFIMKDVIPKIIYEDWQKEWVSFYNGNLINGRYNPILYQF